MNNLLSYCGLVDPRISASDKDLLVLCTGAFLDHCVHDCVGKGPSLYYVSKGTGWVGSEKWQFLLMFSTIYADVGWVGQKKSRNVLT